MPGLASCSWICAQIPDKTRSADAEICLGFVRVDVRANANPLRQIVRIHRRRLEHLDHVKRGRARDGIVFRIWSRTPCTIVAMRHHGRDADHHAKNREARTAACFRAQCVERDVDVLAQRRSSEHPGRCASPARSAVIGSSAAAAPRGYTPKITPTAAPSVTATMTDHALMRAGSGDTAATASARLQPSSTPSTPPIIASTIDSARNCARCRATARRRLCEL